MATSAQLKDVPLAGKKARTTFTLEDVAAFRGSTVDALISQSVDVYLERSNFNDPGEVEGALARVGLPTTLLDGYRDKLGPMMKRRHWIVHRADRNNASGRGHHVALTLQQPAVEAWSNAVEGFGNAIFAQL